MSRRLDFTALAGTDAAIEAARIDAGEPWVVCAVAGLQYYRYARQDELLGRVIPQPGDRLQIIRDPDNEYDRRACEVWWRNAHQLGHLPRGAARLVAPLLDEGQQIRAYVYHPGDGDAWSMRTLLVGAAVEWLRDEWAEIPFSSEET
jgi:hypothetical protein